MKCKYLNLILATVITISAVCGIYNTSSAEYIDDNRMIHKFADVDGHEGKIYCNYDTAIYGNINTSICNSLPYGMYNLGYIYSFTFYKGYIYYVTGGLGTSGVNKCIYRCDMDGSNNIMIAENASGGGYIIDDVLYYMTETWIDDGIVTDEGIAEINLNTCQYEKILNSAAYLKYCDGNYIYYENKYGYYRIDTDGNNRCEMSANDIENMSDAIVDGVSYNYYDGGVYINDWKGGSRWIFNVPRYIDHLYVKLDDGKVENVIYGNVYYEMHTKAKGHNHNRFLMRAPVNGGENVYVASRYRS